jgi:hypothetical protein
MPTEVEGNKIQVIMDYLHVRCEGPFSFWKLLNLGVRIRNLRFKKNFVQSSIQSSTIKRPVNHDPKIEDSKNALHITEWNFCDLFTWSAIRRVSKQRFHLFSSNWPIKKAALSGFRTLYAYSWVTGLDAYSVNTWLMSHTLQVIVQNLISRGFGRSISIILY